MTAASPGFSNPSFKRDICKKKKLWRLDNPFAHTNANDLHEPYMHQNFSDMEHGSMSGGLKQFMTLRVY